MKNLKYVYKFLLAIPLVFMVGCVGTDDYEDVLSNQFTQQNSVFIETDDASEVSHIAIGNTPTPVTVGINNSFSSDVTVSFNVIKDGTPAEEGVDYTLDDATILAGALFASSDVTFLSSGEYVITVANASDGSLITVDNKAIFSVPPGVVVSISWADPFYDYDLYHIRGNQDINGEVLANTFDTIAFETFELFPPEGFSSIFIDDWWDDNAGTDVVMFVEVDGVTEVYDVVMDMDKFVLLIELALNDEGLPEYDFTAL